MPVAIRYAEEKYFKSFHETLDQVARERIYIEMTEALPFEKVLEFQTKLIKNNWPSYFAIETGIETGEERVVGWVDISVYQNPRLSHRGSLGMGLLKAYRGQGLGSRLLEAALEHAKTMALEKVELSVYATNLAAIKLYEKFGFTSIGLNRHFRKLDDVYYDCVMMETFL